MADGTSVNGDGSRSAPKLYSRSLRRPQYEHTQPADSGDQPSSAGDDEQDRVGVCCSGGGIRSAAFNLGALQALWDRGVLGRARYLAAVSGGSYIAAAFALSARYSDPGAITTEPGCGPFGLRSPEEAHLRNRSTYLAAGLGGKMRLAAEVVVGVLANLIVLSVTLVAIGTPLGWAYAYTDPTLRPGCPGDTAGACAGPDPAWRGIAVAAIALGAALVAVGIARAYWMARQVVEELDEARRKPDERRRWFSGARAGRKMHAFRAHLSTRLDERPPLSARLRRSRAADADVDASHPVVPVERRLVVAGVVLVVLGVTTGTLLSSTPEASTPVLAIVGLGIVGTAVVARIFVFASWLRRLINAVAVITLIGTAVVFAVAVAVPEIVVAFRSGDLAGWDWGGASEESARARLTTVGTTAGVGAVVALFAQVGVFAREALTLVEGTAKRFRALRRGLQRALVSVAGGLLGPVALLAGLLVVVNSAARQRTPTATQLAWWAGAVVLVLVVGRFGDLVSWSLHPYYKRRLASAFAVRRSTPESANEIDPSHQLLFSDLDRREMQVPFPELLVCAAANISDGGATPPGVAVTSFVFSPTEIGGPLVGYEDMGLYEQKLARSARNHVTVPAAVAISGAALAPSMGKMTVGSMRFLLALGNVRLGVWLHNPRRLEERRHMLPTRTPARYLLNEVFGNHRINSRYLYVTDGGHYENLGLVELLRRECTTVYCFDAAGGEVSSYRTLGQAVALARTELGVEVDIKPWTMRPPDEEGLYPSAFAVGTIRYPTGREGTLYYVKAGVTSDAPWDVRAFAEHDHQFPTHSTADQLFTGERFEAYRALGAAAAGAALARAERDGRIPRAPAPEPKREREPEVEVDLRESAAEPASESKSSV